MLLRDVPFGYRVLLLAFVFGVLAGYDVARHGRDATRWREYLILFAGAGLGSLVGVLNDLATSRISPEYFAVGKGIAPGPEFTRRVLSLGTHAGFVAGALAAACLLMANNPSRRAPSLPQLPNRRLLRSIPWPLLGACGSGYTVGAALWLGAASAIASRVRIPVDDSVATQFNRRPGNPPGSLRGTRRGHDHRRTPNS